MGALTLTLVATLVSSTQAFAATATIYNPLSLSNTVITQDRVNHAVTFFSGWSNRFAIDIASSGQYANREIYLWGVGWSTAHVLTGTPGNNAHVAWTPYTDSTCQTSSGGTEYAVAYGLDLSNGGETAGLSISHLSNYHQAEGASVTQGWQVANLSWLSNGQTLWAVIGGVCQLSATAPHVHVESARNGTTTFNDVDPGSTGASGYPSWYYNYP